MPCKGDRPWSPLQGRAIGRRERCHGRVQGNDVGSVTGKSPKTQAGQGKTPLLDVRANRFGVRARSWNGTQEFRRREPEVTSDVGGRRHGSRKQPPGGGFRELALRSPRSPPPSRPSRAPSGGEWSRRAAPRRRRARLGERCCVRPRRRRSRARTGRTQLRTTGRLRPATRRAPRSAAGRRRAGCRERALSASSGAPRPARRRRSPRRCAPCR